MAARHMSWSAWNKRLAVSCKKGPGRLPGAFAMVSLLLPALAAWLGVFISKPGGPILNINRAAMDKAVLFN